MLGDVRRETPLTGSSGLPSQKDTARISAEGSNVLVDPKQRVLLVDDSLVAVSSTEGSIVGFDVFRSEKAVKSDTIIYGDNDGGHPELNGLKRSQRKSVDNPEKAKAYPVGQRATV